MGLNLISPIDVKQCKKFLHSVARFGLMSRSRFEDQYKIVETVHFTSFFNIEEARVAHVDVPPV